ncbi:MAG: ankyrin repeat domain-containing protein [Polyangiaceae bacterium]
MNEAERLWRDIVAWWKANDASAELGAIRRGATKRALEAASAKLGRALPDDLAAVLRACDGGPSFDGYELLSVTEIVETWSRWCTLLAEGALKRPIADPKALKRWWSPAWLPFAKDSAGNLVCIDLGAAKPRSIQLEVQDGQGAFTRPGGFTRWLSTYQKRLESGELAVDAEGFVREKTVEPAVIALDSPRPELTGAALTSMRAALAKDDAKAVLATLERAKLGPDVSLEYGRSLLGVAAEGRREAVVLALLERGATVDATDDNGRTPLFWAAWGPTPNLGLVQLLLDRGADPNRRTRFDGTPLHSAVMWEDAEVVAALVRAGADPEEKEASGRSARRAAGKSKALLAALGPHSGGGSARSIR